MHRILRPLLSLAILVVAATGLVACGGGGGGEASSDTDVNTLLDKTFSGKKEIKSGKLDLAIKLNVSGGNSGVEGPIDVRLRGPFESQGQTKLPKFDLALEASGAGQNIKAGVTSTGAKGFVHFDGQAYAISDQVFQQFKQGYEEAAKKGEGSKGKDGPSLATLGIDPRKWLTNPKNVGEAKVGDTSVIRITGGVDVGKLLDDINTALSKADSLGLSNEELPSKLTAEQQRQVEEGLKDVKVEIATGKDDAILRRLKVDLKADDPKGGGKADVSLDLQLLDLNEGQKFPEPKNTKPLDDLLGQFGGLDLGGVLGGSGSSDSGSGSSGSGSSGSSQQKLKKYTDCLEKAGQDLSKAQKCAEVLAP